MSESGPSPRTGAEPPAGLATEMERCLRDLEQVMAQSEGGGLPSGDLVVWPEGLGRRLLLELPFSVRANNCIRAQGLAQGDGRLRVQDLLRIPNLGRVTIREWANEVSALLRGPDGRPRGSDLVAEAFRSRPLELARCVHDVELTLEETRRGKRAASHLLVWPEGLDRLLLLELPLSVRARNCVLQENLWQGNGRLTVNDLLGVPNFGGKSVESWASAVKDLLASVPGARQLAMRPGFKGRIAEDLTAFGSPADDPHTVAWVRATEALEPLLAVACELEGASTLADVIEADPARLATAMEAWPALKAISLEDLVGQARGPLATATQRIEKVVAGMSVDQRTIAQGRLVRRPAATLEALGAVVGVTRERIRQIQQRVERQIAEAVGTQLGNAAKVLGLHLAPIMPEVELGTRLDELLPREGGLAKDLLRREFLVALDYQLEVGMYVNARGKQVMAEVKAALSSLTDDVGLVDEPALKATLPDDNWHAVWAWMRERVGLKPVGDGFGLRDSTKARVKAALLAIGRPATREEIASGCGLDARLVVSTLSNTMSIVRASKDHWGLEDWVAEPYDGIVGETLKRIASDGGSTSVDQLIDELPSRFGVSATSVSTYLKTAKFEVRDGRVSLADPSRVTLRDLDDVIDGRDEAGKAFWTFVVESRFFDGHSVTRLPPEFAKALGCSPDSGCFVHVVNLPGQPRLSVRWPLASTTGGSLGYLSSPLSELGLQAGDRVRVTIIDEGLVELLRDRPK